MTSWRSYCHTFWGSYDGALPFWGLSEGAASFFILVSLIFWVLIYWYGFNMLLYSFVSIYLCMFIGSVVADLSCQPDCIWNQQKHKPLGSPLKIFFDHIFWSQNTHPKYGQKKKLAFFCFTLLSLTSSSLQLLKHFSTHIRPKLFGFPRQPPRTLWSFGAILCIWNWVTGRFSGSLVWNSHHETWTTSYRPI